MKSKMMIEILGLGILLTGCSTNHKANSSENAIRSVKVKDANKENSNSIKCHETQAASIRLKHEMNFDQIKMGNYSSISGKWKEVAFADNAYNGKGITWRKQKKNLIQNLRITKRKMFLGKYELVRGKRMTDDNDTKKFKRKLKFVFPSKANRKVMKKGTLTAYSDGAIAWNYTFYPQNISLGNPARGQLPKAVNTKKERILIFCSNMGNTWIFQRDN